uniref:Uncharacterized protein n=1 Tax=Triticum urartu TaxID=4572 RepID=A0A8R7Q562_TRIUA
MHLVVHTFEWHKKCQSLMRGIDQDQQQLVLYVLTCTDIQCQYLELPNPNEQSDNSEL